MKKVRRIQVWWPEAIPRYPNTSTGRNARFNRRKRTLKILRRIVDDAHWVIERAKAEIAKLEEESLVEIEQEAKKAAQSPEANPESR